MIGRYRGYCSLVFSNWVAGGLGFFMQQLPMLVFVVGVVVIMKKWIKWWAGSIVLMGRLMVDVLLGIYLLAC